MPAEAYRVGELPKIPLDTATFMSTRARALARLHGMEMNLLGKDFVMLTGSSNPELASTIGQLLQRKMYYAIEKFPEESVARLPTHVSEKQAIIVQSTSPPVAENLMELLMMADAAKRAGAKDITAVVPYFGYARQDRKDQSGTSITARLVADMMQTAGITRIMTTDIHAEQETGFFNIPVDNLYASYVLIPYLKDLIRKRGHRYRGGAPDAGSEKRTRSWSRRIDGGDIVTFQKERDIKRGGKSHIVGVQGDMEGYDIYLIDDMRAGGRTLDDCGDFAKSNGARSARGVAVHGLFLGRKDEINGEEVSLSPLEVIDRSPLDEIIVTDTIDIPRDIRHHPKVRVVSIAPLFAEAIYRNIIGKPIAGMVQ